MWTAKAWGCRRIGLARVLEALGPGFLSWRLDGLGQRAIAQLALAVLDGRGTAAARGGLGGGEGGLGRRLGRVGGAGVLCVARGGQAAWGGGNGALGVVLGAVLGAVDLDDLAVAGAAAAVGLGGAQPHGRVVVVEALRLDGLVVAREDDRLGLGLALSVVGGRVVAILGQRLVLLGRGRGGLASQAWRARAAGAVVEVGGGCVQDRVCITGHHACRGQDTGDPASCLLAEQGTGAEGGSGSRRRVGALWVPQRHQGKGSSRLRTASRWERGGVL